MFPNSNLTGKIYKNIDSILNNRSISNSYRFLIYAKRFLECSIKKTPQNFPTIIQIQTINKCNASCKMCPNSFIKNKKYEKMTDNLFKKIIKEITSQNKFSMIHLYLQNEPLLDEDIFKKIRLIKKESKGLTATCIVTNGSLFNDEKIRELEESGNHILVFSIDAFTKETFEKIRQGLEFDVVINIVKKVLSSSYANKVWVGFVIQKDNIDELEKFKKYWKKKGVGVIFNDLSNRTGDLKDYNEKKFKSGEIKFVDKLKRTFLMKNLKICPMPILNFNILTNGDVILCCDDYSKKMTLGNVYEKSIKEIWLSEKYKNIRKQIYNRDYKKIPVCKNCYFWHQYLLKENL